jgi:hypothetical protein
LTGPLELQILMNDTVRPGWGSSWRVGHLQNSVAHPVGAQWGGTQDSDAESSATLLRTWLTVWHTMGMVSTSHPEAEYPRSGGCSAIRLNCWRDK